MTSSDTPHPVVQEHNVNYYESVQCSLDRKALKTVAAEKESQEPQGMVTFSVTSFAMSVFQESSSRISYDTRVPRLLLPCSGLSEFFLVQDTQNRCLERRMGRTKRLNSYQVMSELLFSLYLFAPQTRFSVQSQQHLQNNHPMYCVLLAIPHDRA